MTTSIDRSASNTDNGRGGGGATVGVVTRHHRRRRRCKSNTVDNHHHLTLRWWAFLSTMSLLNIAIWLYSYRTLYLQHSKDPVRIEDDDDDDDDNATNNNDNTNEDYEYSTDAAAYQRYHLILSGMYVFACAYRSFLPRIDLERYCLWDTMLSSIFLGRSAATIAEISFAAQIALYLRQLADIHDHPCAKVLSAVLVPMITIAQCFCWTGVVTLNHAYHAIEESIWAICSLLVGFEMGSLVLYYPEKRSLYSAGVFGFIISIAFCYYMITVDVPMYIRRWKEGWEQAEMAGKDRKVVRMTSFEGGKDALHRRIVTKSWDVWREETVWLTGYFTSAVWLSLLLVHLPAPV
jgi:hypothetical protein